LEKQNFKIAWNSNAPHAPTGYGQVTSNVCYRLLRKGYNVRVISNYGLEGASLGFNELIVYPKLFAPFGEDAVQLVCQNWRPDVLVTLYDVWIGANSDALKLKNWMAALHNRWVAYAPVDHYPIPDPVADQARLAYKVVAMSKFAQREYTRSRIKSTFIPHGVDTKVFRPLKKKDENKKWLEKHSASCNMKKPAKIDEDSFVVGINAANKDPFRKDFGRMFTAFQIFLDNNPDARKDTRFYAHSWMSFPGGFGLKHLARKLGIEEYCKHTFRYDMYCSLPPDRMNQIYNAFDVFLNLSRGEGFGIPVLEAQSCGVPVIATDYTAMTELVKGHGWLIPPFAGDVECPKCKHNFSYKGGGHQFSHLMSLQAIPDEWKAADAIEQAYNKTSKRRKYGKTSRNFALGYDYDKKIMPLWYEFFDEIECEVGMFGKWKGKDEAYQEMFKKAMQ